MLSGFRRSRYFPNKTILVSPCIRFIKSPNPHIPHHLGTDNLMAIDESTLNKGQIVKLNALRKSVGDKLGEQTFSKWFKEQSSATSVAKSDPVADALVAALANLTSDKSFKLGNKGYVVRRAKGKGVSGFVAQKVS